jgi:hypothetical protein
MTYNTKCPWVGLGTQACAPNGCVAWVNRPADSLSLDELAHELGECLRHDALHDKLHNADSEHHGVCLLAAGIAATMGRVCWSYRACISMQVGQQSL